MIHASNSSRQPLQPRRTRTRTGCLSCRRRRKKCDQRKPRCFACERNKIACSWPHLCQQTHNPNDDLAEAAAVSYSKTLDLPLAVRSRIFLQVFKAACTQSRIRENPELSFQVSKNIQHYLGATVDTLAALTPSFMDGLWTILVLREAQTHHFIMDSVDAITAFHCAHLYPRNAKQYVRLARSSNASALSQFRSSVTHVNVENATATLAFTFFQILLCIASPFALDGESSSETIGGLRDLLIALQGFYQLQPVSCPHITDPIITNWLKNQPEIILPRQSHNHAILSRLLYLAGSMNSIAVPSEEKNICFTALAHLYSFFENVPLSQKDWALFFTWPVTLSDGFLELVSTHHPLALIITAHWSVPIFQHQRHWLDKWADKTFYYVAGIVGPEMFIMLHGLQGGELDPWNGAYLGGETQILGKQAAMIPHHCKNPLVDRR